MSNQKMEQNVAGEHFRSAAEMDIIYSDRTVYSLPSKPPDDIVELVIRLMDGDGPRPMKNLRPVKKTRTGADQFYVDHHGEYEARGQPSRDKIGRVHNHNSAYPKMYDELHRRRSTAQPAAYPINQNIAKPATFERNCAKLKKPADLDRRRKRSNRKSTRHRSSCAKTNLRETRSKITKHKKEKRYYRSPSRIFKLSKIMTNKGCQCTSYYLPAEKKSACTFNDINFESVPPNYSHPAATLAPASQMSPRSTTGNYKSTYDISPNNPKSKISNKKLSKSDIDSGNPETNTAPSISSYNSFMSMEHEPMVE